MNTYLIRSHDSMKTQVLNAQEYKKFKFKNTLWDTIIHLSRLMRTMAFVTMAVCLVMYALSPVAMSFEGYFFLSGILLITVVNVYIVHALANKFNPSKEIMSFDSLFTEFPLENREAVMRTWERENKYDEVFEAVLQHETRNHSKPLLELLAMNTHPAPLPSKEPQYLTLDK